MNPAAAARSRPERGEVLDSASVREALGLPPASDGSAARRFTSVSTDSRTLDPGALFIALRGERHDGADFLEQAAARGATGAVVTRGREEPGLGLEYFPVEDPLRGLGALAAARRRELGVRVVGITGSSGKTTVKEMVAAALGGGLRVFATPGNLNSKVGLPLSILRAPEEAEVWVLELGASEPGEIEALTEMAEPDDAVVTTVGRAHLEFFGTVENILQEKLALVRGARPDGVVVVGDRPPALAAEARRLRPGAVVAGLDEHADFRPRRHGLEPDRVWFEHRGVRYQVAAGGEHHLRDALIAAAVADRLGVSPVKAARGLADFRPLGMRGALRRIGGLAVLVDCYNANPDSFAASIDYLSEAFPDRERVAVVGSMLEMGESGPEVHREVLEHLVRTGFRLVAATGAFAPAADELAAGGRPGPTRFLTADDPDDIWQPLAEALDGREAVLVKASRGVRLERIVDRLEDRFGQASADEGSGDGEAR